MEAPDQVLTVEQMQVAERALIEAGTSVDELMQRAGKGAADWIWRISGGRSVTVLCGPGNNGGDGYVIAAEIARRGGAVRVVAPIEPKTDAARKAAAQFAGEVSEIARGASGHVFVDCLFGSGLSRPVSSDHLSLIAELASQHDHAVAVDLASGAMADSGEWSGANIAYDLTLALGAWKRAHWLGEAGARGGRKRLVDIGVSDQRSEEAVAARPTLSAPAWNSHKYRRGLVTVVAGEMPGASALSAKAASGAGAGYVKLVRQDDGASDPPEIVCDSRPLAKALADQRIDCVVVGPGLGRSDGAHRTLSDCIDSRHALVIDADALQILEPRMLDGVDPARIVLTPHEGELASLCQAFDVGGNDKREMASALSRATGIPVLAKGPDTLLASGDRVTYFPRGPSWLSVAGSGDVLAGVVGARLANREGNCQQAAIDAVWLHNEAARQAGVAFSASDLAAKVPGAYATFL